MSGSSLSEGGETSSADQPIHSAARQVPKEMKHGAKSGAGMAKRATTISITGAHGTGKTTLCRALSDRLQDMGACEIGREAPRLIIDEAEDPEFLQRGQNTLERQLMVFLFQALEENRTNELQDGFIIHDRTPVDVLAYTLILNPGLSDRVEGQVLMTAVRRWIHRYRNIYKVPIEFPLVEDGVREPDLEFQALVDQKLDELYRHFNIQPYIVTGSVDERIDQILKIELSDTSLVAAD